MARSLDPNGYLELDDRKDQGFLSASAAKKSTFCTNMTPQRNLGLGAALLSRIVDR